MRRSGRLAVLLALAVVTCARPSLPARLAGLHRGHVWTGVRAASLIGELHGRRVAPNTSLVAEYGKGGELRVYLSLFPDDASAARALDAMLVGMGSGTTPFAKPQREAGGTGRWFTYGPGGHHLLWVSKGRVYWLQGSPGTVEDAAAELPAPTTGVWT